MTSRVLAGVLATLWALLALPPQAVEWQRWWSSDAPSPWVRFLYDVLPYRVLERALAGAGLEDRYLVFGVAIVPAMVLAWWAMKGALDRLGPLGRALGWAWPALSVVTALSYLNHPSDAPLHLLWGTEAFVLAAIFLLSIIVAIAAPRRRGIPLWVRLLVAATPVIGIGATLAGGYWPHATMIGIGLQSIALASWRPRPSDPAGGRTPGSVRIGAGRRRGRVDVDPSGPRALL